MNITLKDAEKLLEDVISGKINKKEAKSMYINSAEDVNKLKKLKPTETRTKKCGLFLNSYKNFFMAPKAEDKVDDETKDDETKDDETDEQPDTTDMPELESEESAE